MKNIEAFVGVNENFRRAYTSLVGLSVGDCFGQQFFIPPDEVREMFAARRTPEEAPWSYSDDSLMALSIMSTLFQYDQIEQEALAQSFTKHFDPFRSYGYGMYRLLCEVEYVEDWRKAAQALHNGKGSLGNGAAMRVAPLGVYFADKLEKVVEQAKLSAEVTHINPEGIVGAITVALAAAIAWNLQNSQSSFTTTTLIEEVLKLVPESEVRRRLIQARDLPLDTTPREAADVLGNGTLVRAYDTVPFAIWCANKYLNNYTEALWQTVSCLGDIDTNCAIVGGIVAAYTGIEGIPADWGVSCEEWPDWFYKSLLV